MSIKDEIIDALDGHGDTHPPAIFTQSATVEQMDACGACWPEANYDAELMARLALQASEFNGFGTVRIPYNITNDAEVFGCEIKHGSKSVQPSVASSPFMGDMDIVDVPADLISADDFMKSERISMMLDAAGKLSKREDLFFTTSLNAPFACLENLLGVENLLMTLMMDTDRVTAWLDAVTPCLSEYAKALSELSDNVLIIEEADSEILPPDYFGPMVGDFLPKVIKACSSYTTIHSCGTTTDVAADLAKLGETALSPEASHDLAGYKALVGDSVKLVGSVDPISVLLHGTPADVVAKAKASAEAGFAVITPECGVSPLTPKDNLDALARYREL